MKLPPILVHQKMCGNEAFYQRMLVMYETGALINAGVSAGGAIKFN